MTTDITELAKSLKAAAGKLDGAHWQTRKGFSGIEVIVKGSLEKRSGFTSFQPVAADLADSKTAKAIALFSPANILALVEALEKAQTKAVEQGRTACELFDEVKQLREQLRTVELSNSVLESRTLTAAATDVLAERQRQVTAEGWMPEHDDEYQHCEMAVAAACYIMADDDPRADIPELWPWPSEWWKPTDARRDLVKAGALILAELERLDRAECNNLPDGISKLYATPQPSTELKHVGYLFVSDRGAVAYSPTYWSMPGFKLAGQIFGDIEASPELEPERDQVRREHAEWSQATFGNVGPIGPLKHLSKEALEAAAEPDDLSEWTDMQFLLWDAQRRAGITDEQITQAMVEKLAVNKQREWPAPKDGAPRLHIRSEEEALNARRRRNRESNARVRSRETPEQRRARLEKNNERMRTRRKGGAA